MQATMLRAMCQCAQAAGLAPVSCHGVSQVGATLIIRCVPRKHNNNIDYYRVPGSGAQSLVVALRNPAWNGESRGVCTPEIIASPQSRRVAFVRGDMLED